MDSYKSRQNTIRISKKCNRYFSTKTVLFRSPANFAIHGLDLISLRFIALLKKAGFNLVSTVNFCACMESVKCTLKLYFIKSSFYLLLFIINISLHFMAVTMKLCLTFVLECASCEFFKLLQAYFRTL